MFLPILEYHSISDERVGTNRGFLYVGPTLFRRQLRVLRALGVRGVSLSEALRLLDTGSTDRFVALTFDDAYRDIFVNALPLLRHAGFSATCYAVSERLNSYNTWDADQLGVRKPTMSATDLLVWRDAGMEVGAHTRTHPRLTNCDDVQLADEVAGSKAALETLLGEPVTQFCYPYGDFDERVISAIRRAGFASAVTNKPGRARLEDVRFALPRVPVRGDRAWLTFPFRVLTRYADRRR